MLPFDDEPDKIHTANFHVFSDSVLCLGTGAQCGPHTIWRNKAQSFFQDRNLSQKFGMSGQPTEIHLARLPQEARP